MSRQILAIGDTGSQLVSKFNGNAISANIRVYNVEDYGAVHNGVTDDTEAIQDAINACHAAYGGIVYFPNGVYLISGALQNGIGTPSVDYNSQIYIPYTATGFDITLKLIGESSGYRNGNSNGVILKSTIAGSGTFPAVIRAKGPDLSGAWNDFMTYTNTFIENIEVRVNPFKDTTGISMSGVDLGYCSMAYVNNLFCGGDEQLANMIEPANPVFGLSMGKDLNNNPGIGLYFCTGGFTYGLVAGDFLQADRVCMVGCKYGLMTLQTELGIHINYLTCNWMPYLITSQIGTWYGIAPDVSNLKIGYMVSEPGTTQGKDAWLAEVDKIYDPDNYLRGVMDYKFAGNPNFTKQNGGVNFHVRNIGDGKNYYQWHTASRPTVGGNIGYNLTSNKMEFLNNGWHDLPEL